MICSQHKITLHHTVLKWDFSYCLGISAEVLTLRIDPQFPKGSVRHTSAGLAEGRNIGPMTLTHHSLIA